MRDRFESRFADTDDLGFVTLNGGSREANRSPIGQNLSIVAAKLLDFRYRQKRPLDLLRCLPQSGRTESAIGTYFMPTKKALMAAIERTTPTICQERCGHRLFAIDWGIREYLRPLYRHGDTARTCSGRGSFLKMMIAFRNIDNSERIKAKMEDSHRSLPGH